MSAVAAFLDEIARPGRRILHPIEGDVMEPTFRVGDVVVGDLDQDRVWTPGVYLIGFPDRSIGVRRCDPRTDGSVELICDNRAYVSETVPAEHVPSLMVIARVIAHARRV